MQWVEQHRLEKGDDDQVRFRKENYKMLAIWRDMDSLDTVEQESPAFKPIGVALNVHLLFDHYSR